MIVDGSWDVSIAADAPVYFENKLTFYLRPFAQFQLTLIVIQTPKGGDFICCDWKQD